MTAPAPSASALTMWPTLLTPPSAMTGTPKWAANSATAYTAVACGRPTAMTSCVMQMLPEPMPTRRPSAPAPMSCAACSRVTTLPAITSSAGNVALHQRTMSSWNTLFPCELSSTTMSSPAATSAASRSRSAGRVPTAAAAYSCFVSGRLLASGYAWFLSRSERATSDASAPCSSTIGSLPFLDERRIAFASDSVTPVRAVTSSVVITSRSSVAGASN
jgi:hypothetical protein